MLRKVTPGTPLNVRASEFNGWQDAVAYARAQQHTNKPPPKTIHQSGVVLVRNGSGADVDRHSVLGIDAPIILPTNNEEEFKSRVALNCITPGTAHRGKFVVTLEPLASQAIGLGYIAGTCMVQVNVTDADHQYADVKDTDETQLESSMGDGSARILWKESGTGTKWAVVNLNALPIGETASPTTLGAANEGSEAADTADWARADDDTPVDLWAFTRVAYYDAGNETLYGYARKLSFDACGLLIAVSGETRITIDVPEECSS